MSNRNNLLDEVFQCMLQANARGENYLAIARKRFPYLSKDQFELIESMMSLFKAGHIEANMEPDGVLRFRAVVRGMPN